MNHDRLQSNRSEENTGEGAKLVAFMLEQSLKGEVPVIFNSNRIIDNDDPRLTVILMHGDYPIDKDSGQNDAWEYGDPTKFNYIVTAHMHSRRQEPKNDGLKFRKLALPAFCPSDNYAKTVSHGSSPGVHMVGHNGDNLVTLDITLKYD